MVSPSGRNKKMKIEISGSISAGYYNAMEAGHPFFIDDDVIDEKIKDALREQGHSDEFSFGPFEDDSSVKNPLIGKRIRISIEIED